MRDTAHHSPLQIDVVMADEFSVTEIYVNTYSWTHIGTIRLCPDMVWVGFLSEAVNIGLSTGRQRHTFTTLRIS
jgi:hypothetical protein